MSHACILNEVFSNLVYMLDESKTTKDTKYLESVLNSYLERLKGRAAKQRTEYESGRKDKENKRVVS